MLRSILDLGNVTVDQIMVHRNQVVALDIELSPATVLEQALSSTHTRIPLYRGSHENIVGVLHAKALLQALRAAGGRPDEIVLTRYILTCCVADATIAQVRVVGLPPGEYTDDEWLSVTGAVYPVGREVLVAADTAEPIPVPEQPYLTP